MIQCSDKFIYLLIYGLAVTFFVALGSIEVMTENLLLATV